MDRGFTILELIIALCIFSAGLLGLLQLHFTAQRELHAGVYTARAALQAYNFLALLNMFSLPANSSQVQPLLQQWNQDNAQLLPEGEGFLNVTGARQEISVFWKSPLIMPQLFCDETNRTCVRLVVYG